MKNHTKFLSVFLSLFLIINSSIQAQKLGVGAKKIKGAKMYYDGTRKSVDENWTYWEGPRLAATLPIKWYLVENPAGKGMVLNTNDPAGAGGKYGAADIVTKDVFKDFRAHVEFYIPEKGGNSGVYLQNRYEIQICDGDTTKHGMAAVINETPSPYKYYTGLGKWNAYDINFRAARFVDGKLTEKAMVTMYFNGVKVHENVKIQQVWGGKFSGVDGGNEGGKGITDSPQGLKLQAEGHNVMYQNVWIKKMDFAAADTDF
jgi:Domain of Unknown Function (DUF1080)